MKKYEFEYENEELSMLTKMIADNIAKENKQFKIFYDCKNDIEYMCAIKGKNVDRFANSILENADYYDELIKGIITNLKILKILYSNDKDKFRPKELECKINTSKNIINISFLDTEDETRRNKITIDFIDIVWCSLLYPEKQLYQILHELILTSPYE